MTEPAHDPIGLSFWEAYPRAKGSEFGRMLERAMEERVSLSLEYQPKGAERWFDMRAYPIADGSLAVLWRDATARREARERLRKSEDWLRSAVEVGKVGLWDWDPVNDKATWSSEHWAMYGLEPGAIEPGYEVWISSVHEDDRERAKSELQRAMESGEDFACEFRVVRPDGSIRWISGTGRFFYDDAGKPIRMTGAMIDFTEQREMQDRLGVMVAELQHRTRNLVGVVQAMADRTARGAGSLEEFEAKFRCRLAAMARVQGLLSRLGSEDRIAFDELLATELSALNGEESDGKIRLEGPRGISLRSSTVQTLALALHELGTNALKYGALGQDGAVAGRGRHGRPAMAACRLARNRRDDPRSANAEVGGRARIDRACAALSARRAHDFRIRTGRGALHALPTGFAGRECAPVAGRGLEEPGSAGLSVSRAGAPA